MRAGLVWSSWLLRVSLAAWLAVPPAATMSNASTPPERLVLEDFEHAPTPDRYARVPSPDGEDRGTMRFRTATDHRPDGDGHALHLSYALEDSPEIACKIDLGERDASRYDHLELWIKGDAEAGFSTTLRIGLRQKSTERKGLIKTGSHVLTGITSEWQRVLVPLNALTGINDWRRVHELSLSFESRRLTAEQGAYLIDDVVLVRTGEPGPSINDPVIPLKKHAWERSVGGRQQALGHIRAKLVGWPAKRLVGAEELPNDDRAFLERLARDTWRGLDALTVRETGLPLDHVRFAADSVEAARAEIGDYTSPTYVGLSMMAAVSAMDLGLVSSEEVQARIARLLDTLDRLETHRGFFFNYYDAISLERTSHFLSFVDSSWLTTGLIVARAAFPELHARCSRLIDAQNYGFFYDPVKGQMSHGYYVNLRIPSEYHYGMLYTEARVGALIAIGKDDAPESLWFEMVRTFPASDTWQTLTPTQRRIKEIDGNRFAGGFYQWRSHDYVPSWGGSMFEALMPTLALDEQRFAPESLGKNDVAHATIQRLYATEVLDYPVWGASPSASPDGTYGEFGVPVLGTLGYPASVVTPHASALALGVTPEQATSNLRTIARRYPIYGEYGFYDAVDPESGEVDPAYLVLDQAMLFLATASFLSDRSIQKRFAADPIVRKALPLIGQERFFD